RQRHHHRQLRVVPHPLHGLHQGDAVDVGRRGEGDHPASGAGRARPLMAASTVLGVFAHVDTATRAIRELRARGLHSTATYSPVPLEDFEEALTGSGLPRSRVRLFTLVGALTGTACGFALTIWTALKWNLITGGKPVVSIPPFVVIAFELTI